MSDDQDDYGPPKPYRREVISPEQFDKLENAIKLGATPDIACLYAGVNVADFRKWLSMGRARRKGPHFDLALKIDKARGAAAVISLVQIEKAASKGDWRAAAWRLSKVFPEVYGDKASIRHEGPDGGPIRVDATVRTTVEVRHHVEHTIGLPPGALVEIGRAVAQALTQQSRMRLAADHEGIVDTETVPKP
jgi:hypothetical protein